MRSQPQRPAAAADHPSLLPKQHPAAAPPPPEAGHHVPWLTAAGFGFLTVNSGMAVYRSRGDRGAVAFVAFSYVDLLALFLCLRWYEAARHGSPALRDRLKAAVWLLTTALTLLFSSKLSALMPLAVAVLVWLMAFATVAGGFYAFFVCSDVKQ